MLLQLYLILGFLGARSAEVTSLTPLVPSNFYSIISRETVMVIYFQTPWCPHCKDLAPEMASAAEELEDMGIAVGVVDASEHRGLAAEAGVRGVPWIKVYFRGEGVDYDGPRDALGLVARIREDAKTAGVEITAPAKLKCGSLEASQDRGGNGGHGGACVGRGALSFGLCKQKLADSQECSALTYKNGECYLHDRRREDHWSDRVDGAIYVVKQTKGVDRCI